MTKPGALFVIVADWKYLHQDNESCVEAGLVSNLRAASIVLESAPWETVVGWLGLLLRMGTEVIGIVHGDAQMFVLKSCSIVLLRSSEQAEQHKDGNGMTPRELVLWVGMSLSDHLRRVLDQCEDVDDKCAER